MKKLFALSMAACMTLSLTACGGSKAEETTAAPAVTETSSEAAETEAATAEAESDKVWVIATDTVFRPFEFTNEKG